MEIDDNHLSKYFPKFGDRIALINFCKKRKTNHRKDGLLKKLKDKLKKKRYRSNSSSDDEKPESRSPSVRLKLTRQIELGWLHYDVDGRLRQVRTKQGGGTRKVDVPKRANKMYILEKGVALFFVNGVSSKGKKEEFDFDLLDFQQNPFTLDLTVEEMLKISGFSKLRFYVTTCKKSTRSQENKTELLGKL